LVWTLVWALFPELIPKLVMAARPSGAFSRSAPPAEATAATEQVAASLALLRTQKPGKTRCAPGVVRFGRQGTNVANQHLRKH